MGWRILKILFIASS